MVKFCLKDKTDGAKGIENRSSRLAFQQYLLHKSRKKVELRLLFLKITLSKGFILYLKVLFSSYEMLRYIEMKSSNFNTLLNNRCMKVDVL